MNLYIVEYKMHSADQVHGIYVRAKNKEEAYTKAAYDIIPYYENSYPYSCWVASRLYKTGREQRFNTFEGNPY